MSYLRSLLIASSLTVVACADEKGDDSNCEADRGGIPETSGPPPDDGGESGMASDGGGDDACDSMADDAASSPMSAPGEEGNSMDTNDSMAEEEGGALGELGDDCTDADQCAEGKCILVGESGFCTRTCTSADDCPEMGWECNLAPYTACVPSG